MNKVIIIGRLGKDPELKYSASGQPITNMSVATDESYTDRDGNKVEKTEWHRIVVFQRQAENCANYLTKGSLACFEGKITTRKWQDQNGQDRYSTEIHAQRVEFLSSKNDNQNSQGQADNSQSRPPQSNQQRGQGSTQRNNHYDDLGPAFPSDASGMDDVPF